MIKLYTNLLIKCFIYYVFASLRKILHKTIEWFLKIVLSNVKVLIVL